MDNNDSLVDPFGKEPLEHKDEFVKCDPAVAEIIAFGSYADFSWRAIKDFAKSLTDAEDSDIEIRGIAPHLEELVRGALRAEFGQLLDGAEHLPEMYCVVVDALLLPSVDAADFAGRYKRGPQAAVFVVAPVEIQVFHIEPPPVSKLVDDPFGDEPLEHVDEFGNESRPASP